MKIIGLTGTIGSGKTTVSQMMAGLGIPVVCADAMAREAAKPGGEILQLIVKEFGKNILTHHGELNRQKLGDIVFADREKRNRLNRIIHPEVIKGMQNEIRKAKSRKEKLIILDIPLLFEEGLERLCDKVVVVYAPDGIIHKRLKTRDELSDNRIVQRLKSQMDIEEKRRRADYVIDNSGTLEETAKQVEALIKSLVL